MTATMYAAGIVSGKTDLSDALFLLAAIVFGILLVVHVMGRSLEGILLSAGLTLVAVGWLVL